MSEYRQMGGFVIPRLRKVVGTMEDWGWFPFDDPPPGQRWKTKRQYFLEYGHPATTQARKQQLIAICCGLLPWETEPDA